MKFRDRTEAGQQLAQALWHYAERSDVLVLALPRGGVPVAFEVAQELNAPLDVLVVRKLGVPGQEEMAMGAIAASGVRFLNEEIVNRLQISQANIEQVAAAEQQELERREALYRAGRPAFDLRNRTVIIVDDGLATGATMKAAVMALRQHHPAHLVVAVPVASAETCQELTQTVDDVVCVKTPELFRAVGLWYEQFPQTTDQEVQDLLQAARDRQNLVGSTGSDRF
jgi:putative phosphoribosyl transferase